jgi:hypothetical protein
MNDDHLIDAGSPRLSDLLHRAADGLDVDPARELPIELTPPRHARRPWLLAVAVLLIVAGIGAAWLHSSGDDSQRIDTGPADEADGQLAPRVIEEDGIWRLPEPGDELEVFAASTLIPGPRFQLAVDDATDPTRWLGVMPGSYVLAEADGAGEPVELPHDATAIVVEAPAGTPTGSTWIEVTGDRGAGSLTLVARGVPTSEVLDIATGLVDEAVNLTDTVAVQRALTALPVPEGLVPVWDDALIGFPGEIDEVTGLGILLNDRVADQRLFVSMNPGGPTAAVAALDQLLTLEASGLRSPDEAAWTVTRRPDLGTAAFVVDGDGASTLHAFSNDGTILLASNAVDQRPGAAGGFDVEPLTVDEQLTVINRLRSMSESELRSELDRMGLELGAPGDLMDDPDPVGTPQGESPTTVQAPTGD